MSLPASLIPTDRPLTPSEKAKLSPVSLARYVTEQRYVAAPLHWLFDYVFLMSVAASQMVTVERVPFRRTIISVPPRHGKSDLFSVYGPAWFLGSYPHLTFGLTSYEATFAEGFGARVRNLLENFGPQLWGVSVSPSSAAKDWFDLCQARAVKRLTGGGMRSVGIGGGLTGKGFHILGIDDPIKNATEALSANMRQAHKDWYQSTAKTRLEPSASVFITMQRWHEDDLAGYVMREEGLYEQGGAWNVVALPLEAEPITAQHIPGLDGTRADPLGRQTGEILWPGRYSIAELAEAKRTTPPFWWNAQRQQRPQLPEGTLFSRDKFRYFEEAGDFYRLILKNQPIQMIPITAIRKFLTVDLAASLKESADYTVFAVWGLTPTRKLLLLDLIRRRMEGPEQQAVLETLYNLQRPVMRIDVESTAYQLTFVQAIRKRGLPVRELKADRDKWSRALYASLQMEAQNILIPARASFRQVFEDEHLSFPYGEHDDIVDVTSYAAMALESGGGGLNIRTIG